MFSWVLGENLCRFAHRIATGQGRSPALFAKRTGTLGTYRNVLLAINSIQQIKVRIERLHVAHVAPGRCAARLPHVYTSLRCAARSERQDSLILRSEMIHVSCPGRYVASSQGCIYILAQCTLLQFSSIF